MIICQSNFHSEIKQSGHTLRKNYLPNCIICTNSKSDLLLQLLLLGTSLCLNNILATIRCKLLRKAAQHCKSSLSSLMFCRNISIFIHSIALGNVLSQQCNLARKAHEALKANELSLNPACFISSHRTVLGKKIKMEPVMTE